MKSQTTVLEAGGLHWATSESVIEKTLLGVPGVLAVDASAEPPRVQWRVVCASAAVAVEGFWAAS